MVVEIKLSNFFSVMDEVVLDMRAANIQTKKSKGLPLFSSKSAFGLKEPKRGSTHWNGKTKA